MTTTTVTLFVSSAWHMTSIVDISTTKFESGPVEGAEGAESGTQTSLIGFRAAPRLNRPIRIVSVSQIAFWPIISSQLR